MAIGARDSSFLLSFLLLTLASAVIVSASFTCSISGKAQSLDFCNSTVECPVPQELVFFLVRRNTSSSCSIVLTSKAVVLLSSNDVTNVTPSAACSPWFAVGQTSSSAATLRESCSRARYRALYFFFSGDVVLTFADRSYTRPPYVGYKEVTLRQLCTPVISLNSTSYVAAPLDFAGGGDCVSRLESPPGTAMRLSLVDSQPRAGNDGGLSVGCVCYSAEGVEAAASGCLIADADMAQRINASLSANVSSIVTLTVKGDSGGLLCTSTVLVTVFSPEQLTSVGNASRLCSCLLLLLLLLLCEAARLWSVSI